MIWQLIVCFCSASCNVAFFLSFEMKYRIWRRARFDGSRDALWNNGKIYQLEAIHRSPLAFYIVFGFLKTRPRDILLVTESMSACLCSSMHRYIWSCVLVTSISWMVLTTSGKLYSILKCLCSVTNMRCTRDTMGISLTRAGFPLEKTDVCISQ